MVLNPLQDSDLDTFARIPKQRKKSVYFADTKGLALTSTFFFAKDNFSSQTYQVKTIKYFNNKNRKANGQCVRLLNFKSPVSSVDFVENLRKNNVCLKNTMSNETGVYGRIQVKNLAFEKEVSVRYTLDSWKTFQDTYARYITGSSTAGTDTFHFQVKPPQTSEDRKMEFAICYKVNDGEFWDNNFGDNYRLIYFSSKDNC